MSDITIEVVTKTITNPTGKKYRQMELIYKNKSFQDKVETKKLIDYYAKEVFPHLEDANPGDVFTVQREKPGEYWEWKGITKGAVGKSSQTSGVASSAGNSSKPSYVADADKQVMIIRQSSISSAVNLVKDFMPEVADEYRANYVIGIAKQFESYVLGTDKQPEQPKEAKKAELPDELNDELEDLPY